MSMEEREFGEIIDEEESEEEEENIDNENFDYYESYKYVKVIDLSVKMVRGNKTIIKIKENEVDNPEKSENEEDDDAEFETFNMPLPIPPNCQLFHSKKVKVMEVPNEGIY
jgi:hypothetical protein